jgi:hypothetical protein
MSRPAGRLSHVRDNRAHDDRTFAGESPNPPMILSHPGETT